MTSKNPGKTREQNLQLVQITALTPDTEPDREVHGMANRKTQRAKPTNDSSALPDVPLAQPSREKPKEKTLLEIASEQQLFGSDSYGSGVEKPKIVTTRINADGSISQADEDGLEFLDDSPVVDVFLYSVSLLILYFTFTFLVHHQYSASPPTIMPLIRSTFISLTPVVLVCLVALLHPRSGHPAVQAIFALVSVAAGAEIVRISNDEAYLAVMQKAPALGVIWVWATVESRWEVALGTAVLVGAWTWLKGYSVY